MNPEFFYLKEDKSKKEKLKLISVVTEYFGEDKAETKLLLVNTVTGKLTKRSIDSVKAKTF